jgi:hypothetical protein
VKSTSGGSATNTLPSVAAGADRHAFLTGESVSLALEGVISDDGLPDPATLTATWSMASGPAPVTFSQSHAAATQVTFTAAGTYVLSLAADDGDLDAHDELVVTIELPDPTGRRTFTPTQDAFTDAGVNNNGGTLAVRPEDRIAYLMFDLTDLDAVPLCTVLRLTEAAGVATEGVILRAYAALSNDWQEAGINAGTAPQKGQELGLFRGDTTAGGTVEVDLGTLITGPGIHGIILEAENGDVSFVSKESADDTKWPRLAMITEGNSPPVYGGYSFLTFTNESLTLPWSALLARADDPDGDPVTPVIVNASSTQGGQVVMTAEGLTFTPTIDYFGPDSFTLTVGDGRGAFTTAQITVQVGETAGSTLPPSSPMIQQVGEGIIRFRYQGVPGADHTLQRSADLLNWDTLSSGLGGDTGEIDYLDTAAPQPPVFYRVVTPE